MSSLLTIAHGSRRGASNDEVRQLADQIHAQQMLTSHLGASTTLPAAILGMGT
jgi:sirohydrochlorin ferrochelatase